MTEPTLLRRAIGALLLGLLLASAFALACAAPVSTDSGGSAADHERPDHPHFLTASAATTGTAYLPAIVRRDSLPFTFAVAADMRLYAGPGLYDTPQHFRGVCEAIHSLVGSAFLVSPGDIDPPAAVEWTIQRYLGSQMLWYPVVGNHEAETPEDMEWLRAYDYDANGDLPPNIVRTGPPGCPETTYSFDYSNAHFVVLNLYCSAAGDSGAVGEVGDALYEWLSDDLTATDRTHIFVFGHEPAYPQPDADNGRLRHLGESLDRNPAGRDRFWRLLQDNGVVAYICGHTHNYSAVQIEGIWQLDAGHARGIGDTGARSTFIMVHVDGDIVRFETYRDDSQGGPYTLADSGILTGTVALSGLTQTDELAARSAAQPSTGYRR